MPNFKPAPAARCRLLLIPKFSVHWSSAKLAAPGRRGVLEITETEHVSRFQGLSRASISLPIWDGNISILFAIRCTKIPGQAYQ
jgi:hypothetical protein